MDEAFPQSSDEGRRDRGASAVRARGLRSQRGYHAASKVIGSQIHWLSLFGGQPIVAHGVGVPSNHSTTELSII